LPGHCRSTPTRPPNLTSHRHTQIPDLVSQRRRWLNGSFFASLHATFHFYYLYRSRHSATRKFFMHILILYQAIQLVFSWFAIGNYFIGRLRLPSPLRVRVQG
jgi:cellulose synthase/poly-beta-1,6-N-acetylglucosamine synthase-like glycosyltransferase